MELIIKKANVYICGMSVLLLIIFTCSCHKNENTVDLIIKSIDVNYYTPAVRNISYKSMVTISVLGVNSNPDTIIFYVPKYSDYSEIETKDFKSKLLICSDEDRGIVLDDIKLYTNYYFNGITHILMYSKDTFLLLFFCLNIDSHNECINDIVLNNSRLFSNKIYLDYQFKDESRDLENTVLHINSKIKNDFKINYFFDDSLISLQDSLIYHINKIPPPPSRINDDILR